jgi:hypothetical protein
MSREPQIAGIATLRRSPRVRGSASEVHAAWRRRRRVRGKDTGLTSCDWIHLTPIKTL